MDFLPLFTDIRNKPCLLIGGGAVALRKARLLSKAGAQLRIVAHDIMPELSTLCLNAGGECISGDYGDHLLDDAFLVIAATDDLALNRRVSDTCHKRHIPVNVVDNPELCSVILPAIIDRSPLVVAVSSGGKSPVLARMMRSRLEATIPASYGRLAHLVGQFRDKVKARFSDIEDRRHFWENALQGPVAEMVFAGNDKAAAKMLEDVIKKGAIDNKGEVYLIGAGPGDPDLMTFKALRLLQRADVVLYDRLVAPAIVDLCRKDADRVYVGKARAEHAVPQQDINMLLVKYAQEGKKVARLKGGDPFIFGRGGEEIEKLAEHRIPFQVVPGITAAAGCASYAGIPLTHRDHAQSVRFVTGHLKDHSINLPWQELVRPAQTVVFYMGLVGLPSICEKLIEFGRSPETPIAVIQQGTTPDQKVVVATLSTMVEKLQHEPVRAPTLIIVGEVVTLREKLAWYEKYDLASANL
ncbi:Siroheme synthase [Zhongshania aliphaticivorans]|uniref:Siroheme synthase n=1 Tax=Zhongshania aliphaticivorans TaxID=1470434 RepID=A0A5S9NWS0_9GAMM|nr:siroheme synthase CysG [Zhongshania aliphaticivorans]CAA0088821.1 Siroheme synthase [Zhongshania aliphaticivorans]CAA0095207.1 Siroheme synthase [Zhongshania aliphaticivorans]